ISLGEEWNSIRYGDEPSGCFRILPLFSSLCLVSISLLIVSYEYLKPNLSSDEITFLPRQHPIIPITKEYVGVCIHTEPPSLLPEIMKGSRGVAVHPENCISSNLSIR